MQFAINIIMILLLWGSTFRIQKLENEVTILQKKMLDKEFYK